VCVALVLAVSGCGKKTDVQSQTSDLEKAFPAATAASAAAAPSPPAASSGHAPLVDANAYVKVALAAVRTNDYAAGVVVLQHVVQIPGLTPEQLMAVQKTKQALMMDLVERAANGDAKAKAALAAIERTRSQ